MFVTTIRYNTTIGIRVVFDNIVLRNVITIYAKLSNFNSSVFYKIHIVIVFFFFLLMGILSKFSIDFIHIKLNVNSKLDSFIEIIYVHQHIN